MNSNLNLNTLWPWAAALAVLLVAWFAPLPRLISGEEELASVRMPETRARVAEAEQVFRQAQESYLNYVRTHDMSALLTVITEDIRLAKEDPTDPQRIQALRESATQVREYTEELQRYAEAGEPYFQALQHYDDELMAWTRSLGIVTEQFRRDTFPIADHLRLYPQPVGDLTPDIPWITAAEVATQTAALRAHIAALDSAPRPNVIDAIDHDVAQVWKMGRSIERIGSLHDEYYRVLQVYDRRIQTFVESNTGANLSPTRAALALGLNVLAGAVTLVGVAALFMSGGRARERGAQS